MAATSTYDLMVNIEANLTNLNNNLNRAGGMIDNVGRQAQQSGGVIKQAFAFAGGLGITSVIQGIGEKFIQAAKMGWDFNSEMEQNLASFKTMLGGSEKEAKKMVDTLTKMASRTPFETTDLAKAANTLMGFGIEASKVEKTVQMLGDASQGNAQKFESLTRAYSQASAAGKLSAEDMNQMIDAGFNPLKVMAEQTGKSMAQLKDEMSKGAISSDMMTAAFEAATAKGGLFYGAMDAQSKTFSGQMSTMSDNLSMTFGQLTKGVFDKISTEVLPNLNTKFGEFQSKFSETGSIIEAVSSTFFKADGVMSNLSNSIKNIYDKIIPPLRDAFNNISNQVMPLFNKIFESFTKTVMPNLQKGFEGFVKNVYPIFKDALNFITTTILPPLIKYFEYIYTTVVPWFSRVFAENMPKVGAIMQNLWSIIKVVLGYLMNAFNEAWPYLTAAVQIAMDTIGPLIGGLIDILGGIITFITGVFTGDWSKAWQGIKDTFKGLFMGFYDEVAQMGKDIVTGLVNGIVSMDAWVKAKVTEFVTAIGTTIKDFFGIASPSKLMKEYGNNIDEGLAEGIKEKKEAEKAAEEMARKTMEALTSLGDATISALKNKWSEQENEQVESLNRQLENVKTYAQMQIDEYDRILESQIKGINKSTKDSLNSKQAEIDALKDLTESEEKANDEARYQEELAKKKAALATIGIINMQNIKVEDANYKFNKDLYEQRNKLLEEIKTMEANYTRNQILEQRAIKQEALRDEMEAIREKATNEIEELKINNEKKKAEAKLLEEFNNSSLNTQLEQTKAYYKNLNTEENTQATARYLALQSNSEELITLLKTYNPKWQDAGKTFGQKLQEGLDSTKASIESTVNSMLSMVNKVSVVGGQISQKLASITISAPKSGTAIPKFANGTNFAPGGMALVGERGPELVNLPRGSQVIPNNKLGGNIYVTIGTLVGSNGMQELGNILSQQLNKKYTSAVGGGVY